MLIPDTGIAGQTRRYYKSDFDFVLRLTECDKETGEPIVVPFPDCDFTALFYTSSKANGYTASRNNGVYTNCFKDGDGIHFVFDNHHLGVGSLQWEPHFELPNLIYPDSIQDLFNRQPLGIELVSEPVDCNLGAAQIEVAIPAVYLTAYDLAVKAGYTGTLEQYITYVNDFPQVVETSKMLSRVLSDFAEGKAMVADALTRQGADTAPDEPMAVMADRILDLRLAVDGQPGIVDQTLGGTLPTYDLLNELRNHQRADYPYCCGVLFPRTEPTVELKMADAYLCSDGFFTEDQDVTHTLTDTDRDMSYVIYYFRERRYTVPTYIKAIESAYALTGSPQWHSAVAIHDIRSYSTDMDNYTQATLANLSLGTRALLRGVRSIDVVYNQSFGSKASCLSLEDLEEITTSSASDQIYFQMNNANLTTILFPNLQLLEACLIYGGGADLYEIDLPGLREITKYGRVAGNLNNLRRVVCKSLTRFAGISLVEKCPALEELITAVEVIEKGTLVNNCASLEELSMPLRVLKSGTLVSNCASLKKVETMLETIEGGTLVNNCASLKEFTVPVETVTNSCLCAGWQQSAERVVIHLPNLKRMVCNNNYGSSNSGIENVMEFYMPNLEHISGTFGRNSYEKLKYIFHLGNKQNGYYFFYMDVGWCNAEITVEPGFRSTLFINYSSFRLTAENMRDIIANLGDNTGYPTLALTLGTTNLAKLTDEDIAIATSKNYTVA